MEKLTAQQIEYLNGININTIAMTFGDKFNKLIPSAGVPVNAVQASGILTLTGVAVDGELVTINGTDIYEFCADTAQSVTTAGNIPVDIEDNTTKSTNNLTIDTQPTSGDTMTVGTKVYTFVPDGTDNADGEITIGTDLATAQAAIVAAINGTDDHNTANTVAKAGNFAANVSAITALVGGTAGDAIATTETFTAGTNIFSAATLASGADCTAANAITALVAAVTASDTQGVGAADGTGDTVDFTADAGGVAGNTITTTTTMANASFGAAALAGGIDGTVGTFGERYISTTHEYVCLADNTIAGANWLRIDRIKQSAGTPVNTTQASGILTLTDVVIDGELVTINGVDIYEFCADTAQSVTTPGNIAVDITASTTASNNTLTVDTQPTSGDTMTIGTKVYTFVPVGTDNADGEISIGADLAGAQAAILAAIDGSDGHNVANTDVAASEFAADVSTLTALVGGVAGDSIATTETFTAGTNIFSAATLGSGADCTAANAITALAAAVTASDTQGVGAADGDGDTVDFTADVGGVAGNAITTTTTMANASFGAATLAGGVDATIGVFGEKYIDASYEYTCIATNTVSGSNWRRVSLGAAY